MCNSYFLVFFSILRLYVSLGIPRFFPSGVHLNAVFAMFPGSFLSICSIRLHLFLNISAWMVVSVFYEVDHYW